MCNKCSKFHSELFEGHITININKETNSIFTGICKEEKHKDELEYYCKTHNCLCCAACISKINNKGNGKHNYCIVCTVEDIKNEKKNKLPGNIKCLEELSKSFEQSINELKNIFEAINHNKDELKNKIQKIFTQIRSQLNEREEILLLDVEKIFNETFFNNKITKYCEKMTKKIELSLEKGKSIENAWDANDNKLNSLINDCLNIENNIEEITTINKKLAKYKSKSIDICFKPEQNEIDDFLYIIQNFGNIKLNNKNVLGKLLKQENLELLTNW
jgi:hypothetical protein